MVDTHTDNQVVCRGMLQGGQAVLAQLVIGNSYSTTPEGLVTYSLVREGRDVRAYAHGQVMTQMAFGQVRRMETSGNADFNTLMQTMIAAGGQIPTQ